jgi:hypothetical protein
MLLNLRLGLLAADAASLSLLRSDAGALEHATTRARSRAR